jgi:hypothetical protein
MPDKPVIAQRTPFIVEVGPGTVYWCQCGRSKTQPFCDGSLTGTEFSPMEIHFEEKKRVAFCSCKQTKKLPSVMDLTRGSNRLRKHFQRICAAWCRWRGTAVMQPPAENR